MSSRENNCRMQWEYKKKRKKFMKLGYMFNDMLIIIIMITMMIITKTLMMMGLLHK